MPRATGSAPAASVTAPSKPPKTPSATRTPTPSPSQAATSQPELAWPKEASALFAPGRAPDEFACPIYLAPETGSFLCAAKDGGVFEAAWNGGGYTVSPVAESVTAGSGRSFYLDELGQVAYLPGTRPNASGLTVPAIVMVNTQNGSRCNLCDYCGWKEESLTVSEAFQYAGGRVLTRLRQIQNGKLQQTEKWAVFDIRRKEYYVLDMSGFAAKNLVGWTDVNAVELLLADGYRLYAACAVGKFVHESAVTVPSPKPGASAPPPTAEQTKNQPYECLLFTLDANGNAQDSGIPVASGSTKNFCGLQNAALASASQQGGMLLYASQEEPAGLYVLDLNTHKEYCAAPSAGLPVVFAHWGKDGAIYYGVRKTDTSIVCYKTDVKEIQQGK